MSANTGRRAGTRTRLGGVAAKLLAQGEGRGVLGVGAPDLDDVLKLLGLGRQGRLRGASRRKGAGGEQGCYDCSLLHLLRLCFLLLPLLLRPC